MLCLLRSWHLTLFIALAALSPTCSPLLDAYFVSPVCIVRCVLVFPYCLSLLNLIGNFLFLFLFLPSPTPPFSCRPFLVRSSRVCPCTRVCEFFHKQRRKWEEGLCETSEFLWLQPSFLFLPSSVSHTVSPSRQLWIWHLNKYESALFFFLSPPPPPFCLRIHTLSSQGTTEGRVSLISLVQRGTSQPAETR